MEDLRKEKDLSGLIMALEHSELDVRYKAVEALGDLQDSAAVPPLVTLLSGDQYSAIRWKSAEALAKIGKDSVEPLIVLLGHPDEDVRWKAAIALGEIGDVRAIDPLIGLLSDPDRYVKGRVAVALGMIGQPAVVPLIKALGEGDGSLRWGAAIALGRIRDPRAIIPLVRVLGDKYENVRSEALASLKAMKSRDINILIHLLNEVGHQETGDDVGPLSPDDWPDQTRDRDFSESIDEDMRERLLSALLDLGDPDSGPLTNDDSGE